MTRSTGIQKYSYHTKKEEKRRENANEGRQIPKCFPFGHVHEYLGRLKPKEEAARQGFYQLGYTLRDK